MALEKVIQSATIRVPLKAYLASDGITPATGVTIAVTISKNGAAFGNPSGGATNATEIANGWYYVDLSTTDTGTAGPLIIKGTSATINPTEQAYQVVAQWAVQTDLTSAVADSVPSDGTRPSVQQAVLMLTRFLMEKSLSGTTMTVKKEDGSTSSMTFTLNSGTNPTSITRAS